MPSRERRNESQGIIENQSKTFRTGEKSRKGSSDISPKGGDDRRVALPVVSHSNAPENMNRMDDTKHIELNPASFSDEEETISSHSSKQVTKNDKNYIESNELQKDNEDNDNNVSLPSTSFSQSCAINQQEKNNDKETHSLLLPFLWKKQKQSSNTMKFNFPILNSTRKTSHEHDENMMTVALLPPSSQNNELEDAQGDVADANVSFLQNSSMPRIISFSRAASRATSSTDSVGILQYDDDVTDLTHDTHVASPKRAFKYFCVLLLGLTLGLGCFYLLKLVYGDEDEVVSPTASVTSMSPSSELFVPFMSPSSSPTLYSTNVSKNHLFLIEKMHNKESNN